MSEFGSGKKPSIEPQNNMIMTRLPTVAAFLYA